MWSGLAWSGNITLVGPPLLHVDFKFVRACDFAERTEDP